MSILAWNCRGLANPRAVRFLKELVKQFRRSLVFLSETLVEKSRIDYVGKRLGFSENWVVETGHHEGGLSLLWKDGSKVEIKGSCENFIDFEVYAEQIGDFNDLMYAKEKVGGRMHPRALLDGFCNVVEECSLCDLGFTGSMYTWERFRGTNKWVQERLDRGLVNDEWRRVFPDAELCMLDVSTSDHLPLLLQLHRRVYVPKKRRFKLENLWLREKDCMQIVESSWNEMHHADILFKINKCFRSRRDAYGVEKYNRARNEFHELLKRQEIYWQQRSKQFWLKDGDQNTRFFHKYASSRRRNNTVTKLKDKDDNWRDDVHGVQQSVFIQGRLLTDNALKAFEINHYIKRKTQGKQEVAGLKLDVSKAYDRLEWGFLELILAKFGFSGDWIARVMLCVKTVSYSFIHNGEIFGNIKPGRGLRQCDPISPYLYIMCVEGLSAIIRRNEVAG
ncbi:uncharacterized protein LOC141702742 [Apium graveolens]|uniref:uncharacterized protein LOC141702742 n=1 Tax=Apium graveolens TaxID=4045 RepID=UPI003D7ACEDA